MNPTWRDMNRQLMTYTEKQLSDMIELELHTARRIRVVERLHQRLCALRGARERQELLGKVRDH
jgi:Cdc6-like AAA superfamily ATPase